MCIRDRILSGCVTPGTPFFGPTEQASAADVVIIQQLQALPDEVTPGGSTQVIAWLKNLGREDVTIKTVELYDYCKGVWTLQSQPENPGTLHPYEARRLTWKLTASDVKFRTSCEFKVRIRYNYNTISYTTIKFINYEEMQKQLELGTFKPEAGEIQIGSGPIKPILKVQDQQPIPVEKQQASFSVMLIFENHGSGFPITENQNEEIAIDLNKVEFQMQNTQDLKGQIINQLKKCIDGYKKNNPKLNFIKATTPPVLCDINIQNANVPLETSVVIPVKISYDYEFRSFIPVTIQPPI